MYTTLHVSFLSDRLPPSGPMQLYTLTYPSQFCGLGLCKYIYYLTRLSSVGWAHATIYTNLSVSVLSAGPMQLYTLTYPSQFCRLGPCNYIHYLTHLSSVGWAHATIYTILPISVLCIDLYRSMVLWAGPMQLYIQSYPSQFCRLGPCNYIHYLTRLRQLYLLSYPSQFCGLGPCNYVIILSYPSQFCGTFLSPSGPM